VNNLGRHGRWAFAEFTGIYRMDSDLNAKIKKEIDRIIELATPSNGQVV
jgi:type III restriction enzyme